MDYFSHSEVPSLCLRDLQRTKAFRDAIHSTVQTGDVVLDAGAGSGIMNFFAAQAGARKVYAVEVDETLCERLRVNAELNGLGSIVEVICSDVRDLTLPDRIDVVVAEMIETWLLDELQVPALNTLRQKGVIDSNTHIIPNRYESFITFGSIDFDFYGFKIPFPIHDWPDLGEERGWLPVQFKPLTETMKVFDVDFREVIEQQFETAVHVIPTSTGVVNAIRLSGLAHLCHGRSVYDVEQSQELQITIDLLEKFYPGIKADIEFVDVATPLSYERYTGNWQGSSCGWLLTKQTLPLSIKGLPKTLPKLRNFYMIGQWVEPGGSVPVVAMSGRNIIQQICQEDRKIFGG